MSALPDEFDLPLTTGAVLADERPFDVPTTEALDIGVLKGDPLIAFRRTLGMFATGVTVITTRLGEHVHGMTANAFMSVSLAPPLILVSIDRRSRMINYLGEGKRIGISVLAEGQEALADKFARRASAADVPDPRFEMVRDAPLVEGALAHFAARVVRSYWGGDHSLFLGQVEYCCFGEGTPLLFHGGRYERLAPHHSGCARPQSASRGSRSREDP
jgi:flavin reductase (DIM6/NTAB) family NADH-FMN oxidoreductase RutF